jgi:CubicO group peptidase (beta-lactamase class C family)
MTFTARLAIALALACLPATLAAQAAPSDLPSKTASGVAFTQPKDWTAATEGPATVLAAPEGNLTIAVVAAGEAATGEAAAAKAWSLYMPEMKRTVRLVTPGAPGDGWDERVNIAYDTSPNERAIVAATAMRTGKSWTVVIVEGSEATANKRSAATSLVAESLRPADYQPESFVGKAAHRLTPERVAVLRDFAAESARALDVPGVGLALIDQGKIVWEGGIGVRRLGSAEPVDARTKFLIASNTKAMTTLLLAVLADEGKLRWDQKVTDLYPAFKLGNADATQATLVRHLICACTGLPRKDLSFILSDPGELASATFTRLAETQPTSKFGELFQYSNLMASAAGYVGGQLAYPGMELGASYDKAMQTRIFDPLGMRDTTFDFKVGENGNWARPHGYDVDGRIVEISNGFNHLIVPHRPAGGAWSSTHDLAQYALLELGKGVAPDGKRLVSEANILERREHVVPIGEDGWYGMGLMERTESGVSVVTHGGTLQGFHSTFFVLPDSGIGAVILTNSDSGPAMFQPFLRRLLEVAYDGKAEAAASIAAAAARSKAQAKARRDRLTIPPDPAVIAGLAAAYRNPVDNGTIRLNDRNGVKWIEAGYVEGPLATRKNADGTVSLVTAGPGLITIEAVVGSNDGKRTLTVRDSQHEYVYTEVN